MACMRFRVRFSKRFSVRSCLLPCLTSSTFGKGFRVNAQKRCEILLAGQKARPDPEALKRSVGVWVERDIGSLRLGAEIAKGSGRARAEVRVGIAF